jgi:hypothetical protein
MSRSIDSRKRDRLREQRYAANDGVAFGPEMTDFERDDIKKSCYKLNASRKRQSIRDGKEAHVELVLKEDKTDGKLLLRRLKRNSHE